MAQKKATDKQKLLCLQMIEAHWDCSTPTRYEFTIYRGKPSAWHALQGDRKNWSPNKRATSKTVKEFKRQILNDEWTLYIAMDFITRHYHEFITLVWRLTPRNN